MSAWTKAPFVATQAVLGAGLLVLAVPAAAQAQAQADQRLERIERQVNALQRAVFPGGDTRFFEPEITPQDPVQTTPDGRAATSALSDVLARLDAIEQQLARLTAATEVNENALAALETRVVAMEAGGSAVASTSGGNGATGSASTGVIPVPGGNATVEPPANRPAPAVATPTPTPTPTPAPAPAGPTAARVAAVQAIAKPATADQGDDEYVYGFRLWEAGFYPEAQQQLALFVERYPDHRRTSHGRNLLGRAYLDAGDPETASRHFLANYNADHAGARAPHSLLYLAEARIAVNDTRRACVALSVFADEYPALATGELQGQYDGLRGRVDCE